MTWLPIFRQLWARLFPCHHPDSYMERRQYQGMSVPHFVCPDCAHAAPVIFRTRDEYWRGLAQQVALPRARKPSAAERARILERLTR